MPTNRKFIFANGEYYHVFNRGVEKRLTFTNKRQYSRAVQTINFYRAKNIPLRFSKFLVADKQKQAEIIDSIISGQKLVDIISYCLMPNHFHLLLKQNYDNGISKFIANFTNSYTKYFNVLNNRVGPLFQGVFKAVHIESDEQLLYLTRYIHLNPVTSYLIKAEELEYYPWSSYLEYVGNDNNRIINKKLISEFFPELNKYKEFVTNYSEYSKRMESISHLIIDD